MTRTEAAFELATLPAAGPPGPRRPLTSPGDPKPRDQDLAVAPDGRALLAWVSEGRLLARLRPRGAGAFGPIERVRGADAPEAPDASFDARTGAPVLTWNGPRGSRRATRR